MGQAIRGQSNCMVEVKLTMGSRLGRERMMTGGGLKDQENGDGSRAWRLGKS